MTTEETQILFFIHKGNYLEKYMSIAALTLGLLLVISFEFIQALIISYVSVSNF